MKSDDIDKLFADKLRGLEGTPSARAWETLNSRLQEKKGKKKGALWISYAAAAAVAILLISVFITQRPPVNTPDIAVVSPQAGTERVPVQPSRPAGTEEPGPVSPGKDQPEISVNTPAENDTAPAVNDASPEPVSRPRKNESKRANVESAPVAPVQPTEAIAKIERPATPVEQLPVEEVNALPLMPAPAGGNTLVVVVQLPEETIPDESGDFSDDRPERKKGGVLNTLKKLKKGEFRELGIKPEEILAFVKEKARNNNTNE